jgi:putative ubiquitin-RnfH superfamily antitoxin RatB of RatAB toxin-antitoxin module
MAEPAIFSIAWIDGDGQGRQCNLSMPWAGEPPLTLATALALPAVRALLPAAAQGNEWAIFGRRVGLDETLRAGDRLELLSPLRLDPKLARRQRAEITRQARDDARSARAAARRRRGG